MAVGHRREGGCKVARYTGPDCRICRREGMKLFLKGERCFTDKCAVERRSYAPGQHGQNRVKVSDYGLQLREKQKLRKMYGMAERQFKRYFEMAERQKGVRGENLLELLERRLDSVVYRMGFASSKSQARQMVAHGYFTVNGRKINIPSYLLKVGDAVELKEKARNLPQVLESLSRMEGRGLPPWLELERERFLGRLAHLPTKEEMAIPIQEQLVVELYSK